jgi:hypothetical protein
MDQGCILPSPEMTKQFRNAYSKVGVNWSCPSDSLKGESIWYSEGFIRLLFGFAHSVEQLYNIYTLLNGLRRYSAMRQNLRCSFIALANETMVWIWHEQTLQQPNGPYSCSIELTTLRITNIKSMSKKFQLQQRKRPKPSPNRSKREADDPLILPLPPSETITPPTNTHKSGNETRYDVQQTPHPSNYFGFWTCEVSNSADLQRCHPIVSQCGSPLRTMSNKVVSLMARSWAIFLMHSLAKLERR